ncbi:hypothetical protein K2173_003325 [Erythroxylum novogranatense]|uniref:Uncharacterized protein n=1 Tax=Erythroxylum novogranatense TaxID=1862640 RepID=A0AAV8SX89_9ROSI|nr:hypothetical protein K2173_003325 [Erythroxylum novogranatense]
MEFDSSSSLNRQRAFCGQAKPIFSLSFCCFLKENMESRQKLELLDQAIKKMLAEKENDEAGIALLSHDDNDQLLLSKLLAELESLKGDASSENPKSKTAESLVGSELKEDEKAGRLDGGEEIVKELRKLKRQNTVTHCLLSVMIVLTVVWQVSEVSLILKVKDGLSHPFKSFGSLLSGLVKNPVTSIQEAEKQNSSSTQQSPEAAYLPALNMPEIPHVDLGLNGEK